MKNLKVCYKLILCFLIFFILNNKLEAKIDIDSIYIGYEVIQHKDSNDNFVPYSDFEKPNYIWHHRKLFFFSGDSILMNESALLINEIENDTLYSESDGGFYFYTGRIYKIDSKNLEIEIKLLNCDYCPIPRDKDLYEKMFSSFKLYAKIEENQLIINNISFEKISLEYFEKENGYISRYIEDTFR